LVDRDACGYWNGMRRELLNGTQVNRQMNMSNIVYCLAKIGVIEGKIFCGGCFGLDLYLKKTL
jgi:hypothetical protein